LNKKNDYIYIKNKYIRIIIELILMLGNKTTLKNTTTKGANGNQANLKGSSKGGSYIMPKNKHIGHH
jgi:hypothetical protein